MSDALGIVCSHPDRCPERQREMQPLDVKSESSSETIETVEGTAYELRPCNRYRWRLKAGSRARLFVAEVFTYVPESEFHFAQDGARYRLKPDGPTARTLADTHSRDRDDADRRRERYFRPVRIVSLERITAGTRSS